MVAIARGQSAHSSLAAPSTTTKQQPPLQSLPPIFDRMAINQAAKKAQQTGIFGPSILFLSISVVCISRKHILN